MLTSSSPSLSTICQRMLIEAAKNEGRHTDKSISDK